MEKTTPSGKILSESKSEINFTKIIPLNDFSHNSNSDSTEIKFGKVIFDCQNSNRRVEEKCEVKFYLQKYLCLKEDLSLKIINKDFKNNVKKTIEKMSIDEGVMRRCLLNLFDGQVVWFVVHKEIDPKQFNIGLKELKIKNEEENMYEDYIYYKFFIESVIYPQPAEPKSLNLFDKYIKKFNDEIRYFISKENYTEGEKWANSIIAKFFTMNKELKKQLTETIRVKLQPELKSTILNKTYCIMKKLNENNKKKDYEQIIQTIEKEYYKYFPEKDDKYIKITVRLAKCYLEVRDLDKCDKVLGELNLLINDDPFVVQMTKELAEIKAENNKKSKQKFSDFFKGENSEDDYEWEISTIHPEEKLNYVLGESTIHSLLS
jgi:hypothetical protein